MKKLIISFLVFIMLVSTSFAKIGGNAVIGEQFIFDKYPDNSVIGVALFKLKASAVNCIRVRRSLDNQEKDIGFGPDGWIDRIALLDFVGTGTGVVSVFYDQVGTNHATQTDTTKQPQIVLNAVNGLPEIKSEIGKVLNSVNIGGGSGYRSYTAIMAAKQTDATPIQFFWSKDASGSNVGDCSFVCWDSGDNKVHIKSDNSGLIGTSTSVADGNYRILSVIKNGQTKYSCVSNGVELFSKTTGISSLEFNNSTLLMLGSALTGTTHNLIGGYTAFIMFDKALTDEERNNIENYFKAKMALSF